MYPGLMLSAGAVWWFFHLLHITIDIRNICVFLSPSFAALTTLATYKLTKEMSSTSAGLFSAIFVAIVPGYAFKTAERRTTTKKTTKRKKKGELKYYSLFSSKSFFTGILVVAWQVLLIMRVLRFSRSFSRTICG